MEEKEKTLVQESANFKKYKGQLENLYPGSDTLISVLGGRASSYDVAKLNDPVRVNTEIEQSLTDPLKASEMSEKLIQISGIYNEMIEYFVNLPLYRYTVVPSQIKGNDKPVDAAKYAKVYQTMISAVEGLSIDVTFPKILEHGLIYGMVYLYASAQKSTETISTMMLPYKYCKKGYTTNFGTDTVMFNFKFFDDFKQRLASSSGLKITEDELFELFPDMLVNQYQDYLRDKNLQWQQLDPKFAASISFSFRGVPPKIFSNYGIADYKVIKTNEVKRSSNELTKILVHQIPHTADGNLIFEVEEALELHQSMARTINSINGLKLMTTFGDTELIELQQERTKENKSLLQAYDNIYYNVGMNPAVFRGDSKESVEASIKKDAALVFKWLKLITNFYNLAINNLFNFNPFQATITLLPITAYDEDVKLQAYRENAAFGIGKLEAVVATGIKQKDIMDKHNLEQFLQLDKILVPLQSTHTQSLKPGDKPEETEDPENPVEGTDVEVDTDE